LNPIIENTAARLSTLEHLQAVPKEKLSKMIVRTLIGTIFVLLGVGLIALQVKLIYESKDLAKLSLWLLGGGTFLVVLGATIWSSQLVITPLKVITGILGGILDTVRKKQ